jgi:hypothetical protein
MYIYVTYTYLDLSKVPYGHAGHGEQAGEGGGYAEDVSYL